MDGFYSIWTGPFRRSHQNEQYEMSDYEILTFVLSVLEWQKHNGDAYLICDDTAREYLDKKGIIKLFEDRVLGLEVDEAINPKVFWAAGKLFALSKLTRPMVMVDLDLIVWKNIDDLIGDSDVYGIHREHIRPEVYPDKEYFKFKNGYEFPEDYDWDALPLNTALLYIKDIDFIHKYADKAIDFMYHTDESNENLKHMVFAEQRLLPILAAKYNKSIKTMFDVGENIGYQEYFTHVWGHKNILKYNDEEKQKFCSRIVNRIKKDYPEAYELISGISELQNLSVFKEAKT